MSFLKSKVVLKTAKSSISLSFKSLILYIIFGGLIGYTAKSYIKEWENQYFRRILVHHSLEIKKQSIESLALDEIQREPTLAFLSNRTAYLFKSDRRPKVSFNIFCSKCNKGHEYGASSNIEHGENHPYYDFETSFSRGLGCFISSEGHILTAKHVISDTEGKQTDPIWLAYWDGKENKIESAEIIWIFKTQDLALLKSTIQPLHWFDLAETRPSHNTQLIAGGHSKKNSIIKYSLSVGSISNEFEVSQSAKNSSCIFHYAPIIPGDSGGPLISESGNLVGIHSKIRMNKSLFQAIFDTADAEKVLKFSIAESVQKSFITSIIKNEK